MLENMRYKQVFLSLFSTLNLFIDDKIHLGASKDVYFSTPNLLNMTEP